MARLFGWVPALALEEERDRRIRVEAENAGLRDQLTRLERQTDHLRQEADRERHLSERVTELHQKLITTIVDMKREGFTPAPFAHPGNLENLALDLDDRILDAVGQRSAGDPGLERRLIKWALAEMRVDGANADDVAQRILDGGSGSDDDEEA